MDVAKPLTRAGGRDNMRPLAGESAVDQLRERVQGMEAVPSAATFDDAGEPVLEFDESMPAPVRTPWTQGGGDVQVQVGIAKVVGDAGGGMYTISEAWSKDGVPELKTNGFNTKTAYTIDQSDIWEVDDYVYYVQIQKSGGGSEYYIERAIDTANYTYLATACGYWIAVNNTGHVLGAAYFVGATGWAWQGIAGIPHPATVPNPAYIPGTWI